MRARAPAILIALLGACCGRAFAGERSEQAWRDLFAQDVPGAAKKQISAVLDACGGDVAKLKSLIAGDAAYQPFKPGWHRGTLKAGEGDAAQDVEFFVRVPKGYSIRKSYPLLLAAHWQNGTGDEIGKSMETLLGEAAERYLILAPTLPDRQRGFLAAAVQEDGYLGPLAWARTNLNVDDDRIYVSGYGQGAYVAWNLAVMHPHLFAAAVPIAGMPYFRGSPYTICCYLENIEYLPVWAIWGRNDRGGPRDFGNADGCQVAAARLKELGNTNFTGTELPQAGHYNCWPRGRELERYLSAHKRSRPPAEVRHFFNQPDHARGYHMQALKLAHSPIDFDKPIRLEIPTTQAQEPDPHEVMAGAGRQLGKRLFKLWGELDRSKNSLLIRPFGVTAVRVYAVEGLFDLSTPAEVRFGRAKWQGKVPVSARCILLHYAATRDATALVLNEIDLDIKGESVATYE